jgi:hypothetical protein
MRRLSRRGFSEVSHIRETLTTWIVMREPSRDQKAAMLSPCCSTETSARRKDANKTGGYNKQSLRTLQSHNLVQLNGHTRAFQTAISRFVITQKWVLRELA